jgi:hypothetical protein
MISIIQRRARITKTALTFGGSATATVGIGRFGCVMVRQGKLNVSVQQTNEKTPSIDHQQQAVVAMLVLPNSISVRLQNHPIQHRQTAASLHFHDRL